MKIDTDTIVMSMDTSEVKLTQELPRSVFHHSSGVLRLLKLDNKSIVTIEKPHINSKISYRFKTI